MAPVVVDPKKVRSFKSEAAIHGCLERDIGMAVEGARDSTRGDDGHRAFDVDVVRREHDRDIGCGAIEAPAELLHAAPRRDREITFGRCAGFRDRDTTVRRDAAEDEAHGATLARCDDGLAARERRHQRRDLPRPARRRLHVVRAEREGEEIHLSERLEGAARPRIGLDRLA